MKDTLSRAKEILTENNYTCVILTDEYQYTSHQRGVKPLLDWYDDKSDLKDGYAADKVVGKAAAYLYIDTPEEALEAIKTKLNKLN